MEDFIKRANTWLKAPFDEKTRREVKGLIEENPRDLKESFFKDLAFGTGGMRGIMGVGTNRINKYTLGKNTQGIANYLDTVFPGEEHRVAIAHDCRHNSKAFAKLVADIFSANGVKVYLFSDLRPTPELSFAVRYLKCHCGIVLTASHNPPEYNGYKVYWQDGGQLVPPQDREVISAIADVEYRDINFTPRSELIIEIDEELDSAFLNMAVEKTAFGVRKEAKKDLKIVYTPLHGTSVMLMPDAFERAGFGNVYIVEEQKEPNGDFPTVESPNPEEPAALKMALALADKVGADIVVGTDPDADRLGVAVRNLAGDMVLLNGNQTMTLMTDFLLKNFRKRGYKGNEFIASTVVSTPLMSVLGADYGVECKLGLTGFKWIAKMVKDFPDRHFLGGGEESFGFMVGDEVRDKDAISSILLACSIAAKAKSENSSFYEELLQLYVKHGAYQEQLVSLVKKGLEGAAEIKKMMSDLRANPPEEFNGIPVKTYEDYWVSERIDIKSGMKEPMGIPKSNVLIFYLEDGSKIAARPSGTEPKIKFYVSVHEQLNSIEEYPILKKKLEQRIDGLLKVFGL